MTSQSSCHVSSRIQHCDNNKTTDGQRLSRDPSENCGRKAPSGIKSNSATTTMPQQQQPCEMWMTKNGFMMKCMDQNNSRRTLMITYHLPLHTLSFAIYSCCHRGHFPTILNNTLSTSPVIILVTLLYLSLELGFPLLSKREMMITQYTYPEMLLDKSKTFFRLYAYQVSQ